MNAPVPEMGPNTAFRINFMAHDNHLTDRDDVENSRFGIAPSLAFGVGTDTRLNFGYFHQSEYDLPDYGIPWIDVAGTPGNISKPANVPRANFYGFKSNDYLRANVDMFTTK